MTHNVPPLPEQPSSSLEEKPLDQDVLDQDVLEQDVLEEHPVHLVSSSTSFDDDQEGDQDFDDDWNTDQQYRFSYPALSLPQKMKAWLQGQTLKRKAPKAPSPQAVSDWLGYYNQLYQTSSPNVEMFQSLLSLHGMWDFKTPFKEGNTHFYNFHPECIFLADINYLLDRYIDKYLTPQQNKEMASRREALSQKQEVVRYPSMSQENEIELLFQKAQDRWLPLFAHRPTQNPYLSVNDSVKLQALKSGQKRNIWHTDAVLILEHLFLQDPSHWAFLSSYMHSDNRKLVCQMIHKETQNNDLLDIWLKHSWLSDKDVLSLRAA